MTTTRTSPATLHEATMARRVDALFNAMSTDFLLREQFVTDPAQIVTEYVRGNRLTPPQADTANRFVYAVLSNPELVRWLREYIVKHRREGRRPDAFVADFGHAVVKHHAEHVVAALLRSSADREPIVGLTPLLPVVLVESGLFRETAETPMPTGADPLTEQSGTHVSGGGGGTDPLTEQSGTHVSRELDDLREVLGPGAHSLALAELMRFAIGLRERGLLDPTGSLR